GVSAGLAYRRTNTHTARNEKSAGLGFDLGRWAEVVENADIAPGAARNADRTSVKDHPQTEATPLVGRQLGTQLRFDLLGVFCCRQPEKPAQADDVGV